MVNTAKFRWASTIILALIYLMLMRSASKGYGYTGYNGFHRGSSLWYWGAPTTYTEPSNRSGSLSGTSRIGGGPGSGK
jgi:hypothetical protein